MKTMHSDERDLTESLYRYSGPALVWVALLAFFAIAGGLPHDEPRQIANAAPAVQGMAHETDDVPDMVVDAPSARDPALRDAAIVEHEALDPMGVGIGRNTTP